MKKIIGLIGLLFCFNGFAAQINLTYFGNQGSYQNYYACSYAEERTENYLALFGATNVEVYCTGGITNWSITPISLSAKFDMPAVSGENFEKVEITGDTWNPGCGLNTAIIREIIKTFKSVQVLEKQDHCAFSDSNFYYLLQIPR